MYHLFDEDIVFDDRKNMSGFKMFYRMFIINVEKN